MASTVATATRRRCPNDRWCGARSRCSAMPDRGQRLVDPRRPARRRAGPGWPGRTRRPRRRSAGRAGRRGPGRRCRPGGGSRPARPGRRVDRAARRPSTVPPPPGRMPLRCSTSVVLPAPLGPSSATRSPRATVQVDAAQRHVPVRVGELEPGAPCSESMAPITAAPPWRRWPRPPPARSPRPPTVRRWPRPAACQAAGSRPV